MIVRAADPVLHVADAVQMRFVGHQQRLQPLDAGEAQLVFAGQLVCRSPQRADVRRDLLRGAVDVLSSQRLLLGDFGQANLLWRDLEAFDP